MSLTTHEKIRKAAGMQNQFTRQSFINSPDGAVTDFFVGSDDNFRIVPEFATGSTVAGISDVQVYVGLSGIYGSSRMIVSSVDIEQGSIVVDTAVSSGASLVVNYSSSAISSNDVETTRLESEAIVNKRLSICYDTPLTVTSSSISSLASRFAAAMLLIRGYGTMGRDTARDGYMLYEQIMGSNSAVVAGSDSEVLEVGELGMICTPNHQVVDDGGNIIPRTDEGVADNAVFIAGGRVNGRLYVIEQEQFRRQDFPSADANNSGGSGRGRGVN